MENDFEHQSAPREVFGTGCPSAKPMSPEEKESRAASHRSSMEAAKRLVPDCKAALLNPDAIPEEKARAADILAWYDAGYKYSIASSGKGCGEELSGELYAMLRDEALRQPDNPAWDDMRVSPKEYFKAVRG